MFKTDILPIDVLNEYAKANSYCVKECDIGFYGVGSIHHLINFKYNKKNIFLECTDKMLVAEIKGINIGIEFSVKRKNYLFLMTKRLKLTGHKLRHKIYYDKYDSQDPIIKWLLSSNNIEKINDLDLKFPETLQVYANAIVLVFYPYRVIDDELKKLFNILYSLPKKTIKHKKGCLVIEGLLFDPQKLPENFQSLIPFIKKWSIGDDVTRSEFNSKISLKEKKQFIKSIWPKMSEIEDYCSKHREDKPIPNEVILLDLLCLSAAEIYPEVEKGS